MTETKSEMFDIYIDESHTTINGEPILIYSLAIPTNLENSIRVWMEVRDRFNLGPEVEIKWALKHSDPTLKAEVKDEMVSRLAGGFLCMVSITKGRDKDLAFVNALRQAAMYAQDQGKRYVNIFYDRDAFRNLLIIRAEIDSWTDLHCTTLASLDSRYSAAIQFADILAGVFNYIINTAFGKPAKQLEISDEEVGANWDITLDQLFRIVLRYSMWGHYPNKDCEDFGTLQEELNCFGTGIMIHGDFTQEEIKTIEELSWFYHGCLL